MSYKNKQVEKIIKNLTKEQHIAITHSEKIKFNGYADVFECEIHILEFDVNTSVYTEPETYEIELTAAQLCFYINGDIPE